MKTNIKNITPAIVGKLPEATAKNIDRLAAYYSAGTAAILEHTAEARKYATAAAKKAQKAAKLAEDGQTVETMKTIKAARDKVSRAAEILAAGAITEAQKWEIWDSYFGTNCTIPDTAEGLSQEIQNIERMASDIYVIANNADSYVNGEKIDIIKDEQPEQEATAEGVTAEDLEKAESNGANTDPAGYPGGFVNHADGIRKQAGAARRNYTAAAEIGKGYKPSEYTNTNPEQIEADATAEAGQLTHYLTEMIGEDRAAEIVDDYDASHPRTGAESCIVSESARYEARRTAAIAAATEAIADAYHRGALHASNKWARGEMPQQVAQENQEPTQAQEAPAPAVAPAEATPRGDEANQQAQEAPAPQEGGTREISVGEYETAREMRALCVKMGEIGREMLEALKQSKFTGKGSRYHELDNTGLATMLQVSQMARKVPEYAAAWNQAEDTNSTKTHTRYMRRAAALIPVLDAIIAAYEKQQAQEANAETTDPAETTTRGEETNRQPQEHPAPQEGGTEEGRAAQTVDPEKVEAAKKAKKKVQSARLICEKLVKRHEVGVFVDLKKNTNEKAAAYVCDAIGILMLGGIITKEQAEAIRAINIETGRSTDGLGCMYERDEEKKREKLAETIIEALNNYIKTGRISVEKRTENVKNDQRAADVFEVLTAAKEACESINEAITAKWLCESHGCEKITAEQHSEHLEYLRNVGDKMDRLESLIVPSLMTAEELQAVVDYRTTGENELGDMCNVAGDLRDRLETMEDEANMERMLDALARIFNADLEEVQAGPVEGNRTTATTDKTQEAAPEGERCAVKSATGEDTPEGVTMPTESATEATAGTGAPTVDDLEEWEDPEGVELPAEPDPVEYPLGVCRYRVKRGSFYKLGRYVLEVQPESGGTPLVRKFKALENLMGWLSQWAKEGGHVVEPYPDTGDPDDLTTQAAEAQQGPPVGQNAQQGPPGLGLGVRPPSAVVCYVWAISFTRTIGSGPGTNRRPAARTGRAASRGPPT